MNYKFCPSCKAYEAYYDGEEVHCNNCGFTTTLTHWEALTEKSIKRTPIEEEDRIDLNKEF